MEYHIIGMQHISSPGIDTESKPIGIRKGHENQEYSSENRILTKNEKEKSTWNITNYS